jgi:hypothetical protein
MHPFSRTCNVNPNETLVAYSRVIERKHVKSVPALEGSAHSCTTANSAWRRILIGKMLELACMFECFSANLYDAV